MAELLAALVIVALLMAIVLTTVSETRRRAQTTTCLSNVRQLGVAVAAYTQDYDGVYPPIVQVPFVKKIAVVGNAATWHDLVRPYYTSTLPRCPLVIVPDDFADFDSTIGYAYNVSLNQFIRVQSGSQSEGKAESEIALAGKTVVIGEARAAIIGLRNTDIGSHTKTTVLAQKLLDALPPQPYGAVRHNGGANYAFLDGHAKWLRPSELLRQCDGTKPCFKP